MPEEAITWLPATYKIPPRQPDPDVTFTTVRLGPIPGRHRLIIRQSDVERWTRLCDDDPARYRDANGAPIAPPSILYFASMNLLGREWQGGGFARYAAQHVGPIPIGRPLDDSAEVTDKYLRRGRGRIVWRLDAHCDGLLVQRHWKVWAFPIAPEEADGYPHQARTEAAFGGWGSDLPQSAPTPFASGTLAITLAQMIDFEGPGEDNVHTNPALAHERYGTPPIAQGALTFGLLCRELERQFGLGFVVGGAIDVRFIATVHAGDVLMGRGEIVANDGALAGCRIWAENASGATVAVGTALARLSGIGAGPTT